MYIHTYELMYKKWVFYSITTTEMAQKKTRIGWELKWTPQDAEYKNIIIFHEISNNCIAQKALGSFLKQFF